MMVKLHSPHAPLLPANADFQRAAHMWDGAEARALMQWRIDTLSDESVRDKPPVTETCPLALIEYDFPKAWSSFAHLLEADCSAAARQP